MAYIFWFSIALIFYAYFGYIILLWLISRFSHQPIQYFLFYPKVTIIFCVYNEEEIIEAKMKNCLDLDYPWAGLHILVISDGSTDKTNDILRSWEEVDSRIQCVFQSENTGKTPCLNTWVPKAKGDIVLFTDANSFLDKQAVKNLVRPFADQNIGLVTGATEYVVQSGTGTAHPVSIYARLEKLAKHLETRLGSCVGADGAIFAMHRSLYKSLRAEDINDFVLPLQVIRQGYRSIYQPSAFCQERLVHKQESDFKRQVRITARTLRAIFCNYDLLFSGFAPLFSFELISHKLVKFMVPFFLLLALVSNLFLVLAHEFYFLLFIGQILFYILALTGLLARSNRLLQWFSLFSSFVAVNLAILTGWFSYLGGKTYVTWRPER